MGDNTLTQLGTVTPTLGTGDIIDQYTTALAGDIVPRNASGVPTDEAGTLGSSTYQFSGLYVTGNGSMTGTLDLGGGIDAGSDGSFLKYMTLEIGEWDMTATTTHTETTTIAIAKFRGVSVVLYSDAGLPSLVGGGNFASSPTVAYVPDAWVDADLGTSVARIIIDRFTGGNYDNTNYNDTGVNRGLITILYEA